VGIATFHVFVLFVGANVNYLNSLTFVYLTVCVGD